MTQLVDTATLASSAGVSASLIRKLVYDGVLTPRLRERRLEAHGRGRPAMWFDLDTSMEILDERSSGCDSPA